MRLNNNFSQLERLVIEMGAKSIVHTFVSPNTWGERVITIERIKTNEGQIVNSVSGKISLLYMQEQRSGSEYKFHIAMCSTLTASSNAGNRDKYVITTNEKFKIIRKYNNGETKEDEVELKVCKHCLEALNYQNYNTENKIVKKRIYKQFNITQYLQS
jgi:hypothetical protein